MNMLSTIHSKYQGETMFCFVCVATVFGYILGVNRVIDAILSKHSDETRVKVVRMLNKYTQTNLGDLAEILASNNLVLSPSRVVDDVSSSSDQGDNGDGTSNDDDGNSNDTNGHTNDVTNETNNETTTNLNDNPDKQEKKEDQEKQVQENAIMSPSSASSVSTSEEDYELVRKNENGNHSKNKNNMKYFEWLNIF
jgi:hypothetical protein